MTNGGGDERESIRFAVAKFRSLLLLLLRGRERKGAEREAGASFGCNMPKRAFSEPLRGYVRV